MNERHIPDIGERLPTLEKNPTQAQVFRYSAVTWNSHKIHYDTKHAEMEGHPGVIIQRDFHGAMMQELIMDWLGSDGFLRRLSWKNIRPAVPGGSLFVVAEVSDIDEEKNRVEFEVWVRDDEKRYSEGCVIVDLHDNLT